MKSIIAYLNPIRTAWATPGDNKCNDASLSLPVDSTFPVTSPFGPRNVKGNPLASKNHPGIDYGVPEGTDVKAAADGTVEGIRIRTADGTYGYHIIISHTGIGKTLYAHLTSGSAKYKAGEKVNAGDVIATSGKTGTKKAHLHFEFAPQGDIFIKDNKVDPAPCLQKLAEGSVTIRDNGNAADDSFVVTVDGRKICETTIGGANSCTLGSLRPNTYTLGVTPLIAPDNLGTYEITVTAPNMTIDGTVSVTGSPLQGTTENHTLKVEATPNPSAPLTMP